MKLLELFAGYGSPRLALKRLGLDPYTVISEIDKYAIQAYEQLHGPTQNYGDITKIKEIPEQFDMWTYGFPCQDLSQAGRQEGIKEGTRSGLLLEVERLLRQAVANGTAPQYLLLENVKALVSKKFGADFNRWLSVLESLGYYNSWKVLNAKDYGVPQNRERVFVISVRHYDYIAKPFPDPIPLEKKLKDVLEDKVDDKYYISDDKAGKLLSSLLSRDISKTVRCGGRRTLDGDHTWDLVAEDAGVVQLGNIVNTGNWNNPQRGRVYSIEGCSPSLNTCPGGGLVPKILRGYWIRQLTPRECWRLMGVPDEEFNKLHDISNKQLYKLAGNSIVVDVLYHIFKQLLKGE